jgi:hypothetical protein
MSELRYTLVGDGSSDKRLLPIINWLLQTHSSRAITATWADFTILETPPRTLAAKVAAAVELYPADLLFVHRDAETAPRQQRVGEIVAACAQFPDQPFVPVIPIRMHEAWLLTNEEAIRTAAGKPRGRIALNLPPKTSLENHPDPKQALYTALETASELSGRHLRRFKVKSAAYRVSELMSEYSSLRGLSAFDALEADTARILQQYGLR